MHIMYMFRGVYIFIGIYNIIPPHLEFEERVYFGRYVEYIPVKLVLVTGISHLSLRFDSVHG